MTAKRFKLGYVCGDYGLIDNDKWIDLHSMSENSEKNVQICINKMNELAEENEELKKVLGAILLEVKQDISNTNQTGEIRVFINPNSFNLISEVLRKYGVLKEWYK